MRWFWKRKHQKFHVGEVLAVTLTYRREGGGNPDIQWTCQPDFSTVGTGFMSPHLQDSMTVQFAGIASPMAHALIFVGTTEEDAWNNVEHSLGQRRDHAGKRV